MFKKLFKYGKLENVGHKLKGCRQIVNGIDLGLEYERLYKEYSILFDNSTIPQITAERDHWKAMALELGKQGSEISRLFAPELGQYYKLNGFFGPIVHEKINTVRDFAVALKKLQDIG